MLDNATVRSLYDRFQAQMRMILKTSEMRSTLRDRAHFTITLTFENCVFYFVYLFVI
jgi:hypothetical protein